MKASVRPPGLNAGDLNMADKPPFSENTGTRPNLTVSPGRPRVLGPDCAPSTLFRGMYPGLIQVPPTYCCNTSHRHLPPPTLTGAAPAGGGGGHPAIPLTGSPTDLSIGVLTADTTLVSPSFRGASLLQVTDGGVTGQSRPDYPTTLGVAAGAIFGINNDLPNLSMEFVVSGEVIKMRRICILLFTHGVMTGFDGDIPLAKTTNSPKKTDLDDRGRRSFVRLSS
ncbi:hypothetical protein TIFTF001_004599 [Ficus carica]|uniref:Uncharacterized protein n=1 Tax=Ficus carica TaxID=3494 RepID=A0AA88CWA2_FICCA|nr:hypothetical protein TIFTF001_004599 [Ficus carica]